jgi:tetrapyrrole methylase family protein/MazG family protein
VNKPLPDLDDARLTVPTADDRARFGAAFERLIGVMARLRGEGGCPWDREQDLKSLRPYLVEEAYEVLEAIESGDVAHHQEELGDLLLQVVFQSEIRRQEGAFDAADVAHGIADKLVRRHPHVFGEARADSVPRAFDEWEKAKAKEKGGRSIVDGVPRALPALLRAQRTGEKASRVGFDWPDVSGALAKVKEEIAELEAAIAGGDKAEIEHELGDLVFATVNVARFTGTGAEDALHAATERYRTRFQYMERRAKEQGLDMATMGLEALDVLWEEAKRHYKA